jgi:signal transduction histidine kinase
VVEFLDDLTTAAALEAANRGIRFMLMRSESAPGAMVEADRQVLSAVVNNLLQNAFKFTRPGTTVVLRAGGGADRVLIEVEDGCGGLPTGDNSDLFQPFEQRATDRTGSGLGLAFCRSAIEGSGGRIYARSLPGVGCIFTVDLPRFSDDNAPRPLSAEARP